MKPLLIARRSPQRLHAGAFDRRRGKGGDIVLHRNGGISLGNGSSGITVCWGRLRSKMIQGWYKQPQQTKDRSQYHLLFGRVAVFAGWFW